MPSTVNSPIAQAMRNLLCSAWRIDRLYDVSGAWQYPSVAKQNAESNEFNVMKLLHLVQFCVCHVGAVIGEGVGIYLFCLIAVPSCTNKDGGCQPEVSWLGHRVWGIQTAEYCQLPAVPSNQRDISVQEPVVRTVGFFAVGIGWLHISSALYRTVSGVRLFRDLHSWFNPLVGRWIDLAGVKTIRRIDKAVELDEVRFGWFV